MATPGQERSAGESKNARCRKQKLQQQPSPVHEANTVLGTQNIAILDESPQGHPTGKLSKAKEIPLAEQLAGAISKSNGVFDCCHS